MFKKFLLAIVLLVALSTVQAQRVYFVYLQADNGAPFFVKMGDKVFSSTASGYLILSNLKDSTYTFTLGRTGKQLAETRFALTITNNDKGYLIKDFDYGIGLFDLQTLNVIKPVATATGAVNGTRVDNPFTQLLAKAVGDTSLLFLPAVAMQEKTEAVVKTEPPKKTVTTAADQPVEQQASVTNNEVAVQKSEPPASAPIKDTTSVATNTASQPPQTTEQKTNTADTAANKPTINAVADAPTSKKEEPVVKKEEVMPTPTAEAVPEKEYKRSVVTRRSESSTTEGFGLVFLDKSETGTDTIRLLIPNPKNVVHLISDETGTANTTTQQSTKTSEPVVTKQPAAAPKYDCIYKASDNEFKKLRRAMVAKNSDEAMLNEARKAFKNTCYTTDQLRSLSALFLSGEGKYSFFDIAYQHAVDADNFASLGSEIKDDYYTKRFNALIGK